MVFRIRPLTLLAHLLCVAAASTAEAGTLADTNGVLRAWGQNNLGQATVPEGRYTAVTGVGGALTVAIREDGTLAAWGTDPSGSVGSLPVGSFTAVAGGRLHAVALRSDGTLVGFGSNYVGQTTVPAGNFIAVATGSGSDHNVAVRADGSLVAWGLNSFGQTVVPAGTFSAVAAVAAHSLAVRTDGTLAGWGANMYGQATVPAGSFVAVAAGSAHSLAIRQDGTLAGWGANESGQRSVPAGSFMAIAAGNAHSLGIRDDGSLVGWGASGAGQIAVPSGRFVAVAASGNTSYALEARTVYTDNLQVFGTGMTANLNRDIRVAGNLELVGPAKMFNAPIVSVAGDLVVGYGESVGTGTYRVLGRAQLSGPTTFAGATLQVLGDLQGFGSLTLQDATASFGMAASNQFFGGLRLLDSRLSFAGTGEVGSFNLSVDAGSRLSIGPGQRFTSRFASLAGVTELVQGELTSSNDITIGTMGRVTGRDATLRARRIDIQGTLALAGGLNEVHGDVTNRHQLEVSEGADVRFEGNFANGGDLRLKRLGGAVASAAVSGAFTGTGTVSGGGNLRLEGGLQPGEAPASIGVLQMAANLQLGASARTVIDIGGSGIGQHDQVQVDGDLVLGGSLVITELGSFTLGASPRFDVLTAKGTVTGQFLDLADGARVGTFGGVDLYIDYTPGGVALYAPVPETATLPMLTLGLLALALQRRQRRIGFSQAPQDPTTRPCPIKTAYPRASCG
jgi:hypothetical protein